MDNTDNNRREKRTQYLEQWYRYEKSARRIGAIILFFAAALIVVYDKPGDSYTAAALAISIAGSVTLLLASRQPRSERNSLNFMRIETQSTRSTYAGIGAVLLFTLFANRPLAIICGAMLVMLSLWFSWRARKARQFDELFKGNDSEQTLEETMPYE